MSNTRAIIWIIVYIVLLLLIYISYGVGINVNEFPNSYDQQAMIWILFTVSLVTFMMTAMLHVLEYRTTAAIMLILSIATDAILGAVIGTIDMKGEYNKALGYVVISPFIYKLFLFMFLNWDACSDGKAEVKVNETYNEFKRRLDAIVSKKN